MLKWSRNVALAVLAIFVSVWFGAVIADHFYPPAGRAFVTIPDGIAAAVILLFVGTLLRFLGYGSAFQMVCALLLTECILICTIMYFSGSPPIECLRDGITRSFVWSWFVEVQRLFVVVPWLFAIWLGEKAERKQFSLRTLMIGMMLASFSLAAIVYAAKQRFDK